MVSFEHGEELRKIFFVLSRAWDKEKNSESPRGIEPQTFGFAFQRFTTSHRDSSVSEVYYEVHTTRVLHTAWISNVDSVMFLDRNSRDIMTS